MKKLFFIPLIGLGFYFPCIAQLTDNGDGTVTDAQSCLTWLQSSLPANQGNVNCKSWQDAMSWADALVFAGHADWRLPSALEFGDGIPDLGWNSINNEWGNLYGNVWHNPANTAAISPMLYYPCCFYWTSTENPGNLNQAAAFFLSYDGVWENIFYTKSTVMRYTAVRGTAAPGIASQCRDGYDNDNDGKIDYPADPGCSSADDNSEYNRPTCFKLPLSGRWVCLLPFKFALPYLFILTIVAVLFYFLGRRKRNKIH